MSFVFLPLHWSFQKEINTMLLRLKQYLSLHILHDDVFIRLFIPNVKMSVKMFVHMRPHTISLSCKIGGV